MTSWPSIQAMTLTDPPQRLQTSLQNWVQDGISKPKPSGYATLGPAINQDQTEKDSP